MSDLQNLQNPTIHPEKGPSNQGGQAVTGPLPISGRINFQPVTGEEQLERFFKEKIAAGDTREKRFEQFKGSVKLLPEQK